MNPMIRLNRTFALLVLSSLVCYAPPGASAEEGRRALTIEDLYRVQSPGAPSLSPDGSFLVYSLRSTDLPRGKSNVDLYRVAAGGGEPRRLTWTEDAAESSPVYSPDGQSIAFVARRGEQEHAQLWLLPAKGGEAKALTDISTGVSDPVWSPDGRFIAFASEVHPRCGADDACNREEDQRRADGPLAAHVADELLYRHWTFWYDGKVSHVLLVDVESGAVRDMTPGEREAPVFSAGGGHGFEFSPDGKELCYTRNPDPVETLAWSTNSDLWVVPVEPDADGRTRPSVDITADNPAWDGTPRYSPDGRYIAYRMQRQPGFESDLFRLALYDREKKTVRTLAAGFDDWVFDHAWLPGSDGLVFTAPFEGRTPLYRAALDGSPARKLAEHAYIDAFVLSPDGRKAYVARRSVGEPGELWVLDLEGRSEPLRLTRHNAALEQEVDIRPAETIWVEGAEGRRIQVFVVKPHGFDPAKRYPLILNVHGGPQGMWADSFRGDWQVYPGAGYVVAFPNPHGSIGYGQPFVDAISRDWGGRIFEDLMKVTDYLERLPWVDPERMGAMGWSFGGYMMNWFQGHTDRFKTLANMMGAFDVTALYLATEELWWPEWDLGGPPWGGSPDYAKWNPADSMERFNTPMLLITGELDYRIPYTQSLMAFTVLRRRGVPSRLIVLPDAGHWPGWYEMALYYTAHLDWFHRYLGGAPPPWSVEDFAADAVFDPETGERIDGAER